VQLRDAPATPEVELLSATLHERRLPGDGELDLTGFVGALQAIGAPAPIGVEIFSDELHARRPTEAAALAGDAVRRVLSSTPSATGRSA
jgi:4-hydroxyphenylpyruvate dioxygenase